MYISIPILIVAGLYLVVCGLHGMYMSNLATLELVMYNILYNFINILGAAPAKFGCQSLSQLKDHHTNTSNQAHHKTYLCSDCHSIMWQPDGKMSFRVQLFLEASH